MSSCKFCDPILVILLDQNYASYDPILMILLDQNSLDLLMKIFVTQKRIYTFFKRVVFYWATLYKKVLYDSSWAFRLGRKRDVLHVCGLVSGFPHSTRRAGMRTCLRRSAFSCPSQSGKPSSTYVPSVCRLILSLCQVFVLAIYIQTVAWKRCHY